MPEWTCLPDHELLKPPFMHCPLPSLRNFVTADIFYSPHEAELRCLQLRCVSSFASGIFLQPTFFFFLSSLNTQALVLDTNPVPLLRYPQVKFLPLVSQVVIKPRAVTAAHTHYRSISSSFWTPRACLAFFRPDCVFMKRLQQFPSV